MSAKASLLGLVLCIATTLSAGLSATPSNDEIAPAKKVADQAEAVKEAQTVDLPLLVKADKLVIEEAKANGRKVTVDQPDAIDKIRKALVVKEVKPSGGKTALTVSLYRGDRVLRKVWVYRGGEWGFERDGTSWTTGNNLALWEELLKALK